MIWWVLTSVALVVVLLAVRDLTRPPGPVEPGTHEPVWEDRYGHHARQAQGWNIQPPGGHAGSGL